MFLHFDSMVVIGFGFPVEYILESTEVPFEISFGNDGFDSKSSLPCSPRLTVLSLQSVSLFIWARLVSRSVTTAGSFTAWSTASTRMEP
jgi:hypothetical protein